MSKRNLLLCFDAFGTLFTPKRPVHVQYAEVAQSLGLGPFSEASVKSSFKEAFKRESSENPNFGKANGLNAEQWWSNIIQNTFKPLIDNDKKLPPDLVPLLLHRFWSKDGYQLMPDVQQTFQRLRDWKNQSDRSVFVGVVTNSDDRVPDILTSLGLEVSPLRYGSQRSDLQDRKELCDIDFCIMSFDVGYEKPDRRVFQAAEETLSEIRSASNSSNTSPIDTYQKVYAGDDYEKDILGALDAGWDAVLIAPQTGVPQYSKVKWLDEQTPGNVLEEFEQSPAIGFSRLGNFAKWLPGLSSVL